MRGNTPSVILVGDRDFVEALPGTTLKYIENVRNQESCTEIEILIGRGIGHNSLESGDFV